MPCQALAVDRTQDRSTDVHKVMHAGHPLGPVDRAVDRLQVPHSRVGAADRTVDREAWHGRPSSRPASKCSLELARSTWRSNSRLNGQFFDRWPVDRKVNFDLAVANGQNLYGGYLYPI